MDNLAAVCEALASAGVAFKKTLSNDRSFDACKQDIAIALDPDGYHIALLPLPKATTAETPNKALWRFSHTMLRVKNVEESIYYYDCYLGMSTLRHVTNRGKENFEQAFVGYYRKDSELKGKTIDNILGREGVVELVQYRGTDKDPEVKYHNGNDQPQGFGHLCISVDDLDLACERFDNLQDIKWKKRLTDGRMKNVAFLIDPDGYWIEYVLLTNLSLC